MHTRKRVQPARRKESGESEHKKWASPRKRQRTDYTSVEVGEDRDSNSDNVEEENENSEDVLPRWVHLDVTCGSKKGVLYVEILERGQEDCIESDGRWFSPSGFEEFGGKGAHKKWKNSITYKNQPLHFWIDRGYLKPPPIKRRTFAASEPSNPKKSHPKESVDKSNHEEKVEPDEQPETSEEQTDVQNGEKTDDFTIDIVSIVSQRKPKLILHRLEHLQGDFHLLLNNVVLPQNDTSCMPTEEQSEEKTDLSKDDAPGPVETSEPQEETLLHSSNDENEEQDEVECMDVEDTMITQDQAVGTSLEGGIIDVKNEEESVAPCLEEQSEDDAPGPVETSEHQEETLLHSSNDENEEQDEVECMDVEDTIITMDQEVGTSLEGGIIDVKNEEESVAPCLEEQSEEDTSRPVETSEHQEETILQSSDNENETQDEVEIAAPSFQIHLELEEEETTPPDVIIQDSAQLLIERPPQVDNACTLFDPAAKAESTSAELDVMDLEELKREKIKWQIKVLKLQEEYYSLQLQKLKQ